MSVRSAVATFLQYWSSSMWNHALTQTRAGKKDKLVAGVARGPNLHSRTDDAATGKKRCLPLH